MPLDNAKNFAKATVSTGYTSAATSVVLTTGHGAKMPTVPFNAVWWNSTDYADPSDDPSVEIVRVTAISTDTLTVTRAQEGTTASNKNTAAKTYKMIAGLTAKTINSELLQIASITLTPTDINNMFTTPVTVVPGVAGKIPVISSLAMSFIYGGTQYTGGGGIRLIEETSGTILTASSVLTTGNVTGISNVIKTGIPVDLITRTSGKGVQVSNASGSFASGNGTLQITVSYYLMTI